MRFFPCRIPDHNCGTCGAVNFTACNTKTFTYVIGGIYKGGDVPEGMAPLSSGIQMGRQFLQHGVVQRHRHQLA